MNQEIKLCNKCNKQLPINNFNKKRKNKDGLDYYCKSCNKEYRFSHRKEHNEYKKKWRKNNKEKVFRYNLNGKRYKKEYGHNFTYKEWIIKLNSTKGICKICGRNVGINKLTMDHNPPVSLIKNGHTYHIKDVDPICKSCNCSKGDRMISREILGGINLENKSYPFTPYSYKKYIENIKRFKRNSKQEIEDNLLYELERNFYDYCRVCGNMIEETLYLNGVTIHTCDKCRYIADKCLDYE